MVFMEFFHSIYCENWQYILGDLPNYFMTNNLLIKNVKLYNFMYIFIKLFNLHFHNPVYQINTNLRSAICV